MADGNSYYVILQLLLSLFYMTHTMYNVGQKDKKSAKTVE